MAVPMAQNGKEEARAVAAGSCLDMIALKIGIGSVKRHGKIHQN